MDKIATLGGHICPCICLHTCTRVYACVRIQEEMCGHPCMECLTKHICCECSPKLAEKMPEKRKHGKEGSRRLARWPTHAPTIPIASPGTHTPRTYQKPSLCLAQQMMERMREGWDGRTDNTGHSSVARLWNPTLFQEARTSLRSLGKQEGPSNPHTGGHGNL